MLGGSTIMLTNLQLIGFLLSPQQGAVQGRRTCKGFKIHITSTERDKWNGGQLAKLTKDDGKRTQLANGADILALSSGFILLRVLW